MKSIIASAALVATAAALSQRDEMPDLGSAKIVNRCSYPVYLWSIEKELGCPSNVGTKLETGGVYSEQYKLTPDGGISIKLSKFETCSGKDITQFEYKIDTSAKYQGNYLDMSFVDCTSNLEDCPGRTDGFYLKAGNQDGLYASAVSNQHCPIFSVYNAEEAAKVSYINWDDPQTKWCNYEANTELYLCGGEAPGAEAPSSAAPSSEIDSSSAAKPSSKTSEKAAAPSTTEDAFVVAAAAAVTEAPVAPAAPVIKTEIVYVTEYVNKRHAHGRRHQHFNA